jgi:hypothetical protein
MLEIKIIGAEDNAQKTLLRNINEAVKALSLNAKVNSVTDWEDIIKHDIIHTPAFVVRNQVISQGFVPNTEEIEKILKAFLPSEFLNLKSETVT